MSSRAVRTAFFSFALCASCAGPREADEVLQDRAAWGD
jgi:hypothetical protein